MGEELLLFLKSRARRVHKHVIDPKSLGLVLNSLQVAQTVAPDGEPASVVIGLFLSYPSLEITEISLFSRVKGSFKTPESQILDKITAVPFYELSNPPPPIQLNWLFLFLDAAFTGAGVALAWRYWTYEVPGDQEGTPPKKELRPANQRLALACFHIGIGSVVALRLINVRRSHVRKLWLFPGSVPGNYRRATVLPSLDTIVVENYSLFNPRVEFTLERNAYQFAAHKQDAILRLTPLGGREDGFVLLTDGVHIDGKPASRGGALWEILNPFRQSKEIAGAKAQSKKRKRSPISNVATDMG